MSIGQIQAAALQSASSLGYTNLKPLQEKVIVQFCSDKDVFGVLPTGYGKSLCYAVLPTVFDIIRQRQPGQSFAVVVTPLIAIMKDQTERFSSKGLKATYVCGETQNDPEIVHGVLNGRFQLVFFSPEVLLSKRWRKALSSEPFQNHLIGLIIDEAHCVKSWGDTFRTVLSQIGELRSLIPPQVHIMALTATATSYVRLSVSKKLGLKEAVVISAPPCLPNVTYIVNDFTSIEDNLMYLVDKLKTEGISMGRVIIYCKRVQDCADLYIFFKENLGSYFLSPTYAPDLSKFRVVDMFTSITDTSVKNQIIKSFTSPSSPLRIVIATMAFGMGIDCPDVRTIINLGPPEDIDFYIQQTGRAGRDGLPAKSILLWNKQMTRHVQQPMLDYCKNTNDCRRDALFRNYDGYVSTDYNKTCSCCDVCALVCVCTGCQ